MSAPLRIGIDLGTTFSCVAALDGRGQPAVVPNALGEPTTPSVLWFDGHEAVVGWCAYDREAEQPGQLITFAKRNTGKPAAIPPDLHDRNDKPETAPYVRAGYNWGVVGVQALLLRRLRADALAHFRRAGQIAEDAPDDEVRLAAVVTVPAYFRDVEREQTRQAGEAAGLHVLGVINEPTAAALAYRLVTHGTKRVFVFDLGGGTFDVTIIELTADGTAEVLASEGNMTLGGNEWDEIILRQLRSEYARATGAEPPESLAVELRRLATAAKIALSTQEQVTVAIPLPDGGSLDVVLHRAPPPDYDPFSLDDTFYFETKATNLLTQIRAICESAFEASGLTASTRNLPWTAIDEIVMVGGSCRMPMIPALLEAMAGGRHHVRRQTQGFDFDTAVAIGAALYAHHPEDVLDVSPATYGIKLFSVRDDRYIVHPLIHKNARLPVTVEQEFAAGANAVLELYQGESPVVALCVLRGSLALDNPEGTVRVILHMDAEGALSVRCVLPDGDVRTVAIRSDYFGDVPTELAAKVRAVTLASCSRDDGPPGGGVPVGEPRGTPGPSRAGPATRTAAGLVTDVAGGVGQAVRRAASAGAGAIGDAGGRLRALVDSSRSPESQP